MQFIKTLALLLATALAGSAAVDKPLADQAYDALRAHNYDVAIPLFRQSLAAHPAQPSVWKDLAYVLLKTGDNEAAMDAFGATMKLDTADLHVAMEYAFLAYEQNRKIEARRIFNRIRTSATDPQLRRTAEAAFHNVDSPLAEGIARWKQAVAGAPDNFSAHEELAHLAEQRDELDLAAQHYLLAWKLKPAYRPLLVELGRVYKAAGKTEDAMAALLAASRGAEPHAAEKARELLPTRYPYVYEFRNALTLDQGNIELHRELAYLLLAMSLKLEAEHEFHIVADSATDDLLSAAQLGFLMLGRNDQPAAMPYLQRVLDKDDSELADRVRTALKLPQTLRHREETPRSQVSVQAKELAERSYNKGYMTDALKYLRVAHETDPIDFQVMLKLGWVNNILHDDAEAVKWFELARRSPDEKISNEATSAFRNLNTTEGRQHTTFWTMPFYSSRWQNMFNYSQLKSEFKVPFLPVQPYFSMRFIGDVRGSSLRTSSLGINPQYFSESSIILGVGIRTPQKHGVMAWAEAGTAVRYLNRKDLPLAVSDYRAGLSIAHAWRGPVSHSFIETTNDAVYISRFQNNGILYSQNRIGYQWPGEDANGTRVAVYWNINATVDMRRQYWANFAETGPGIRFRFSGMPSGLMFTSNFLRGAQLINTANPGRPNFYDLRMGFWYAISR